MDLLAELREEFAHLNPIILAAPAARCGISLVQRLLNSGGECMIFAQSDVLGHQYPLGLANLLKDFDRKDAEVQKALQHFMHGERFTQTENLFPDFSRYAERLLRQFYELLQFYHEDAHARGFHHWGLCYRLPSLRVARMFFSLLPNYRSIVLQRDLLPLAAAHHAQWPQTFVTENDYALFGRLWASHAEFLKQLTYPHLSLSYEGLQQHRNATIQQLREFLSMRVSIRLPDEPGIVTPANENRLSYTYAQGYSTRVAGIPEEAQKALLLGAGEVFYKKTVRDNPAPEKVAAPKRDLTAA